MSVIVHSINLLRERMIGIFKNTIELLPNIIFAVVFFYVFYYIGNKLHAYLENKLENKTKNILARRIVSNITYAGFLCIITIITLAILNLEKAVLSLLTGAGVLGVVLGFAFQDLSANLIGGIIVAFQAPFEIGHFIKIGVVEGTVSKIGLRVTHLTLGTKEEVYIPNKTFLVESLVNYTQAGERKINIKMVVPPSLDFVDFRQKVQRELKNLYGKRKDTEIEVYAIAFLGPKLANLGTQEVLDQQIIQLTAAQNLVEITAAKYHDTNHYALNSHVPTKPFLWGFEE